MDSYETNAKNPQCFEVIVNIDKGDELMINFIKSEINKRTFKLKYIETTGGYFSGHLHNNLMLQASDKSSYFFSLPWRQNAYNYKELGCYITRICKIF